MWTSCYLDNGENNAGGYTDRHFHGEPLSLSTLANVRLNHGGWLLWFAA